MRSASRVAIMLSFRNGFEGGRTAVIASDAVNANVSQARSPTRRVWLVFVFSPNLDSHCSTLLSTLLRALQALRTFASPPFPSCGTASLAMILPPSFHLHQMNISGPYAAANLRTCLTRSKYDTKVVSRSGYVVVSCIPKGNLSMSKQGNGRDNRTCSYH